MNLDFDILELYFAKTFMVILMFKIRIIFLDVSRICQKNAVSELIKLSQLVNDTWQTIYCKAQFYYLQKDTKIYSLRNASEVPVANPHACSSVEEETVRGGIALLHDWYAQELHLVATTCYSYRY